MSKCDDGGAAFPGMMHHDETGYGGGVSYTPEGGMSLRDYFAAKAMQAFIASTGHDTQSIAFYQQCLEEGIEFMPKMAQHSYRMADAMLLARKDTP